MQTLKTLLLREQITSLAEDESCMRESEQAVEERFTDSCVSRWHRESRCGPSRLPSPRWWHLKKNSESSFSYSVTCWFIFHKKWWDSVIRKYGNKFGVET